MLEENTDMPDNTFGSTEMFTIIQKLATSDSWDSTFYLLEQEQATLLRPEAEATLLAMIERKRQQNAPHEEIDVLARYLPLLRDMREYGLPAAWEAFTYALLDDETRLLVNTAFIELENATTSAEMKLIFEHTRSLFLSEAAELFQQYLFAGALQRENEEKSDMIDALRRLKTFFDLQRLGDEEEAWKFLEDAWKRLEARDQQQTQEIFNALNALEGAERLDDLRTIFVEKQAYLLTEKADQVLDFLIQEIEEDSGNPRL